MVFALMDVDRYAGSFLLSCGKMTRNDLIYFELSLNSDVLNNYPIEMKGKDSIEFYRRWLENTKRLDNPFSTSVLTQAQFDNSNFLMVHNFNM